jgi:toxin HigB-1
VPIATTERGTSVEPSTVQGDLCHVMRCIDVVIRSFADRRTEPLWVNGTERRLPPDIARRAVRKLSAVDAATSIDDLRVPPGHRLHPLEGDRTGQYASAASNHTAPIA